MKLVTDEEADALLHPPDPAVAAATRHLWAARWAVLWDVTVRLVLGLIALYALIRFIKWAWTD